MPQPVDHLLFLVIVVGLALRAWFSMRSLRAIPEDQLRRRRPTFWLRAIVMQWSLVLVVSVWWALQHRSFGTLGLVPHFGYGFAGVMLGLVLMAFGVVGQRRSISRNPELRDRLRKQLAKVKALMPQDAAEYPGFASLAITAGLCEEYLFRGYVAWWLAHWLPAFWMVLVAQAVLFGLAHAYQGPRGVFATGAVGLFMGAVVWVTGSLWAAMILHALIDLHAGMMSVTVYSLDGADGVGAARA